MEIGERREQAVTAPMLYLGGFEDGAMARDLSRKSTADTLSELCVQPDLDYLVSWRDLGATPYPTVTMQNSVTGKSMPMYLYRCNHASH